jgi:hypothetical protein
MNLAVPMSCSSGQSMDRGEFWIGQPGNVLVVCEENNLRRPGEVR